LLCNVSSHSISTLPNTFDLVIDEPLTFEQIVDAHYAGLYRFALSMCKQEATAQDLVQQTFLQWAKKGDSLRDTSKVKTWLFTTIYREYLGIARREKKHEHVEFEPDLHGATEDEGNTVQPRVDNATLQLALDQLDPNYRAPLVLFYLKELSYRDIAEALSVPIGTVMSRLSRAKDALRTILLRLEESAAQNILPVNFNS
jgi:RNA polymerase sigma factor (sigma-70 family)